MSYLPCHKKPRPAAAVADLTEAPVPVPKAAKAAAVKGAAKAPAKAAAKPAG